MSAFAHELDVGGDCLVWNECLMPLPCYKMKLINVEFASPADFIPLNVEFASPADFIPLPSQWEMHARFIGRYGSIDVFYFDFYSIALSKMERGNSRDVADVKLLVEQGIITLDELDQAY